ncbi:hypothetical protein GCM10023187_33350 [Nibrella viscosa]|uniref:Lipopolysaccharide biosynthesis protein n=1 Tax=Nibrella viscosa TaxID=1084524 RepID=A0ABP8KKW8_9BACT
MTIQVFFRVLRQNLLWFILLPLLTAVTVFFLTSKETKKYTSQATVYTGIASGYNLKSDQTDGYMDYSSVVNAFDNLLTTLNARQTLHHVGISLLEQHLRLEQPDTLVLASPGFQRLQKAIPAPYRRNLTAGTDSASLHQKLDALSRSKGLNPVKSLVQQPTSYYSVAYISKNLRANRKNSSDMLDMAFESDDAAVAQQALSNAIRLLNQNYTSLRSAETSPVIQYYEEKAGQARQRLDQAEGRLRAFNVQNQIINFDEETKNMAFTRETFTNNYNEELMKNRAARASLDALNRRMGQRGNLLAINTEISNKQAELSAAETQLINAQANNQPRPVIDRLQARVTQVSEELRATARKYYAAGDSPESVPQEALLSEWLAKVIALEESTARLTVFRKRLDEYEARVAALSPLQSQLRQLTRELSVAEKEYFSLTENLNQARAHRQDIAIDRSLKVLDPPTYPFRPESSKRWVFVAVGLAIGLFLALLLTALRFWLDQRITTPEQAERITGRPVVALFPVVRKFSVDSKESRTALSMLEQLASAINIDIIRAIDKPHPPIITLFSVRTRQGKTWLAHGLARLYAETGQRVAYCYPRTSNADHKFEQDNVTFLPYTLRTDFMNMAGIDELLLPDFQFKPMQYDKIILELPALISSPIPLYLVNQSSVSTLVIDADSTWKRAEKLALAMYMKSASPAILTVLNRVSKDFIDAPSRADFNLRPGKPERLLELQGTRSPQHER